MGAAYYQPFATTQLTASCSVCFAQCARRNENCGRTASLRRCPRQTKENIAILRIKIPIQLILFRVTFFFSPGSRDHQGDPFWKPGEHKDGCDGGAERHQRRGNYVVFLFGIEFFFFLVTPDPLHFKQTSYVVIFFLLVSTYFSPCFNSVLTTWYTDWTCNYYVIRFTNFNPLGYCPMRQFWVENMER